MSLPVFRAGYLPGLKENKLTWQRLPFGQGETACEVEVPVLTPAQMTELAERVRTASQRHLKTRNLSYIIAVIDTAVARLLDEQDPYRQQLAEWLPRCSGLAPDMVRLGLNAFLKTFRALQLQRFVAEDFANPKMLDEFQPRPKGGWAKAVGPDLLLHVWAGNVPALPLWSLVSGLLVKAGTVGKVASAEPVFASLMARLLVEVEPRWADCLAVVWWQGGDVAQERVAFAQADVVLAYGGNDSLSALQQQVPITTRFLPHGHKLSFGMVAASALSIRKGQEVVQQAALDVMRYEQSGCYSPQVFYVAKGGRISPLEFAQRMVAELQALQPRFPRRALSLEEAAAVAAWRESQAMQSLSHPECTVLGQADDPACVVYSDQAMALQPTALMRSVLVVAVNHLGEVPALLKDARHVLQTAGLAASPEELMPLAQALGDVGVTRICAIGAMTSPEAGWHHDGRFSLLDLVRMVDIEASTELSAESFAPYDN